MCFVLPSSASRYDPKFTVKTMKHPGSVMMWEALSGNLSRAGFTSFLKMQQRKEAFISTF